MKKTSLAALLLAPALLAGCSQIARNAADNKPVDVLHLGGQTFSGSLHPALQLQTVGAQASNFMTTLTLAGSFDDLDLSSLPGIVGTPSGLDIPVAFASANFTACGTDAPTINVTVRGVSISVKDAGHPSGASLNQTGLSIPLTLNRSGDHYTVSYNGTPEAAFLVLSAPWAQFAPIAAKTGDNTPNTFTASVDITTDQGADRCAVTFKTPDNLTQRARFQ